MSAGSACPSPAWRIATVTLFNSYATLRSGASLKTKHKFTVVIERDEEGYYVATVPALRGCHTQAKNLDTLMKRVREVVEPCLEEQGRPAATLELVGIQQIAV
jgi:predicted RNase H-like HicB family nuclease